MNPARVILLLFLTAVLASAAHAYEQPTHRELAVQAVFGSVVLNPDASLLRSLGLPPLSASPTLENSKSVQRPIPYLFADGVDFEDETFPQIRPMHHFYDPVHSGSPLNPCVAVCFWPPECGAPFDTCYPSPDWALEDTQSIAPQEFSLEDARTLLYEALTSNPASVRAQKLGRSFETVGHVIHHLQDMAQPQHVRNDPHLFEALYEKYVKDHPATLNLSGYAPVTFDWTQESARAFWAEGQSGIGAGIAEFTSRNFVSTDTNLVASPVGTVPTDAEIQPNPLYPFPGPGAHVHVEEWSTLMGSLPPPANNFFVPSALDGKLVFVETPVVDYLRPQALTNPRTTTWGLYDADLAARGLTARFTQNRFNFHEAQYLLLPRAVGYSAGLIDYFFRGIAQSNGPAIRLTAGAANLEKTITITNNTGETLSGSGEFEIWYDSRSNGGQRMLLGTVPTQNLPPDGTVMLTPQQIDTLRTDGPLDGEVAFVYRGAIGIEPNGIAARVCRCPSTVTGAGTSDPERDCEGICPCSYLNFVEGTPGGPGDGVAPAIGNDGFLTTTRLWHGEWYPEGATVAVIGSGVNPIYIGGSFRTTDEPFCSVTGGVDAYLRTIAGYSALYASLLGPGTGTYCGGGQYPVRPMGFFEWQYCCASTLDAALVCANMGTFPE